MSADMELSSILNRRQQINEALENGEEIKHTFKVVNIYTEFDEFSRKEIKDYQTTFNRYVTKYAYEILRKANTVMTLRYVQPEPILSINQRSFTARMCSTDKFFWNLVSKSQINKVFICKFCTAYIYYILPVVG